MESRSNTTACTNNPKRSPQAYQSIMPIQMILIRMSRVRDQFTRSMPFIPHVLVQHITKLCSYCDRFLLKVQDTLLSIYIKKQTCIVLKLFRVTWRLSNRNYSGEYSYIHFSTQIYY